MDSHSQVEVLPKTDHELAIENIDKWIRRSQWAGFILIAIAIGFSLTPLISSWDYEYNEYGDWVGGVPGVVTSLAGMAFLFLTYQVQRKQIIIQQEEIHKNERRTKIMHMDQWFFNLLQMHLETVRGFDAVDVITDETIVGKDCFNVYYLHLSKGAKQLFNKKHELYVIERVKDMNAEIPEPSISDQDVSEVFRNTIIDTYSDLDVFFMSLGSILHHISKMEKEYKVKSNEYVNIVRSHLSQRELVMIYYYSLIPDEFLNPIMVANKKTFNQHGITFFLRGQYKIPPRP